MPTGGIKIVCEANLSSFASQEEISRGARGLTVTSTSNTSDTIKQMFVDSEPETYKHAAGFQPPVVVTTTVAVGGRTYVNLDSKSWQGGVTTVVSPSSSAPLFADIQTKDMSEEKKLQSRSGRRPASLIEEELCPEEEERRRVRRERNKLAAARCRKRRVDQTDTLQGEVNQWENKKRALQDEIHALQAQKEELQFILQAHRSVCKRSAGKARVLAAEPADSPRVIVKSEPTELTTERHLTHEEAMDAAPITTTTTTKPQRPITLSLGQRATFMRSIEGIPIETPTNVVNSLNFDALMDGRTGLTPTSILTPIHVTMSTLNTPSVSSSTPTCGSQQRSSGSLVMAELGSPSSTSFSLVSL